MVEATLQQLLTKRKHQNLPRLGNDKSLIGFDGEKSTVRIATGGWGEIEYQKSSPLLEC